MKEKVIYIVEAIVLLLCLCDMPYGYFQFIRFASMCVFGYLAYIQYTKKREGLTFAFGALALLFQPFVKITLGRVVWNIVDVAVAVFLLVLCFVDTSSNYNKNRKL